MSAVWALVFVLALAAPAFWLWGVQRWYRLQGPRPTLLYATCEDGWRLGVHHRPARVRRYLEPVILAHGLSVDHRNMDFEPPYSLAHCLAEAGFDCYSVDWRGTGASRRAPAGRHGWDYSVDDHIRFDAPALISLALAHSRASAALWVGHSLGGLVGYGVQDARLKALVTIGSPAFFRDPTPRLRDAVRWAARAAWPWRLRQRALTLGIAPWAGRWPLPFLAGVTTPGHMEPKLMRKVTANLFVAAGRRILLQFEGWIARDEFRSLDGKTDYRARMRTLTLPVLVVGGEADRLATPASVRAAFDLIGSKDKALAMFGPQYAHGDMVFGAPAPTQVYPAVLAWLSARATRLPAPDAAG